MKHILAACLLLAPALSPAQNYWQQRVDTRIEVTLDDQHHYLRGLEVISYTNNAPDTLKYIYMHLWPNAYMHDHTSFAEQQYRNRHTDFYYAPASQRGFIDSLAFVVDGNDANHFFSENTPDIARIDLPRPLPPGGTMQISTPFRVKLPGVFSRLGHNKQAYFISQWFPKPAVYDRKGWHPMPYLDLGEFYSEIGSYDVQITLPANYVVMATGNLVTDAELTWLDSLAAAPIRKDSVYKTTVTRTVNGQKRPVSTATNIPPSDTRMKTVRFVEDQVHDFAWFADKRWAVRKDTVVSPGSGELVTTWSAFLPAYEKSWSKANEHLKNAVRYYGKWVGPYPYKTIKAVQGDLKAGGGMEYPTITLIDINQGNQTVLIHEAGHNWFYGILASNERDHAWMDEGLNTFYELKTTAELAKADSAARNKKGAGAVGLNVDMDAIIHQLAASGRDQPIAQTSNDFKEINYGMDVYYKTASLMRWLEEYMGEEAFERGMQDYYQTWKHRHPYPEDFRAVMEKHTDKPLGWFFDEALGTGKLFDFAIKDVATRSDGLQVRVKNRTSMALPVIIAAYKGDSLLAKAVSKPFTGSTRLDLPETSGNWTSVRIHPDVFDARTPNNEYRRTGLFHRSGIAFRPLLGITGGSRRPVYIAPAIGYNMYDGFEAGLLFHNLTWPESKFKYALAPMYGFGSGQVIGAGSVSYGWKPDGFFNDIYLQVDGKSFHAEKSSLNIPEPIFRRYVKLAPSLNFGIRPRSFTSPVTRRLTLKGYYITEQQFAFPEDPADTAAEPRRLATIGNTTEQVYGLIRYQHRNDRIFNPFGYSVEGQCGEAFAKLSVSGNLKINYHTKKKALYVRGYFGKYFSLESGGNDSRYYLNSVFTGVSDYLYDDTYIGRSERDGFGIRQISVREGGLKVPTPLYAAPLGRSDNWLAAVNLKTDLPLKNIPLRLFFDVATFADAGKLNPSGNKVLFDGGVEIYLFDIINIYVPLVMSKDFNDYRKSISGKTGLLDAVTFSLNLHEINWLKAPSGIFRLAGY